MTSLSFKLFIFIGTWLILATAVTHAQIDTKQSYFLLHDPTSGAITINSLDGQVTPINIGPHSTDLWIDSVTDTVGKRIVLVTGLHEDGPNGATSSYTLWNITLFTWQTSQIGKIWFTPDMELMDVTFDTSVVEPVIYIRNSTSGTCSIQFINSQDISKSKEYPLLQCTNLHSVATVLTVEQFVTVAEPPTGNNATICFGKIGQAPLKCLTAPGISVVSVKSTPGPNPFYPIAYGSGGNTVIGQLLPDLSIKPITTLISDSTSPLNFRMPTYWDPLRQVYVGAWKAADPTIQMFVVSIPIGQSFIPLPVPQPTQTIIGLYISYKPLAPVPRAQPFSAPVKPNHTGLIVGLVIGGIAIIGLAIGIFIFVRRSFSFQYTRI